MTRTLLNVVDVVVLAISLKSYIPTNETILCGFNEAEVHFEVSSPSPSVDVDIFKFGLRLESPIMNSWLIEKIS